MAASASIRLAHASRIKLIRWKNEINKTGIYIQKELNSSKNLYSLFKNGFFNEEIPFKGTLMQI